MQCSICYTSKNLVYTACNHKFCEKCIKSWLQIKQNCPVCRRAVWDYRKCTIVNMKINEKINKKIKKKEKKIPYVRQVPVKTRSKTREHRMNILSEYLDTSYNIMCNINNNDIHQKIKIVENIFNEIFSNLFLIRQVDNSYIESIENLIYQLENNPNVIHNNYLDKVKLWKYKIHNI